MRLNNFVRITKQEAKRAVAAPDSPFFIPEGHWLEGFLLNDVRVGSVLHLLRVRNSAGADRLGLFRSTPIVRLEQIEHR